MLAKYVDFYFMFTTLNWFILLYYFCAVIYRCDDYVYE